MGGLWFVFSYTYYMKKITYKLKTMINFIKRLFTKKKVELPKSIHEQIEENLKERQRIKEEINSKKKI